ncbi:hypothetical protein [Limnobacter sp.]|uniref:hypothetical protein n=1 Tax=Limnobacter sp. TaxID=2003368 RepID=UPI002588E97D|nr:hypothetical protein [Limnobacter sp.]
MQSEVEHRTATGVVHEINNSVGFVDANLNVLQSYVHDLLDVVKAYQAAGKDPLLLQAAHAKAIENDMPYLRQDVDILVQECRDNLARVRRAAVNRLNTPE